MLYETDQLSSVLAVQGDIGLRGLEGSHGKEAACVREPQGHFPLLTCS